MQYGLTEPVMLRFARRKWKHKRDPLISVYIPTYNRPKLLVERGLVSVLRQTYKNFEVIIVDDGTSKPGNTLWLWPFLRDKRWSIKYFWLPPERKLKNKKDRWLLGPTRAANYALSLCGGDWRARNDDDDIWTEDHLEKLLRFAQQNDYEFVTAAQRWEYPDHNEIKTWQDDMGIMEKIGGIQTSLYRGYLKFFKFNKHCWRKKWNANNDIDLPTRMHKAGVRMGFLNEVVTIVKPRPGETKIGLEAVSI